MKVFTFIVALVLGSFSLAMIQPAEADQNRKAMKIGQKALKLQYKIEKKGVTKRLQRKATRLQEKATKAGLLGEQTVE